MGIIKVKLKVLTLMRGNCTI